MLLYARVTTWMETELWTSCWSWEARMLDVSINYRRLWGLIYQSLGIESLYLVRIAGFMGVPKRISFDTRIENQKWQVEFIIRFQWLASILEKWSLINCWDLNTRIYFILERTKSPRLYINSKSTERVLCPPVKKFNSNICFCKEENSRLLLPVNGILKKVFEPDCQQQGVLRPGGRGVAGKLDGGPEQPTDPDHVTLGVISTGAHLYHHQTPGYQCQ